MLCAKHTPPCSDRIFTSIFVTGGAGFIGSNFLRYMAPKYQNIKFICFDALQPCASLVNLEAISDMDNFVFVHGDICDTVHLMDTMKKYGTDAVVHFAAESSVDKSNLLPNLFTYTNIAGSMIVAECCHSMSVKLLFHASTDEVYGETRDDDEKVFVEDSPLNPTNPYSFTKAIADVIIRNFSGNIPVIKPDPAMSMSPGDMKYTVHGTGQNKRSFLYVSDCCAAYELLLFCGRIGAVYNIGTGTEFSNLEIAQRISNEFGIDCCSDFVKFVPDRMNNDLRYWMDSSLMSSYGWKPLVSFENGLHLTVEWYKTIENDH